MTGRIGKAGLAGAALAALLAFGSTGVALAETRAAPREVRLVQPPERDPADLQVLFWSDAQRAERFRAMEQWFAGHEVPPASQPRLLAKGADYSAGLEAALRTFMAETNAAGVMVLEDGKVRFAHYALGMGPEERWTSFSVAKSFTSTLLGAAVKDGFIKSLDDPVTQYIPGLAGSAYEGVTVRQLATMTSGVKWNEDYTDPNSDVAKTQSFVIEHGADAIVAQMRSLPREAEPGAKWVYKTGETNLIGVLVENAVGKPLAEYAAAKIVEPAGFEGGLFWMVDPRGGNVGGCCLSLRLADYARMGQMVLEGGRGAVGEGWFAEATDSQVDFGDSGFGYGYQWWTYQGGTFGAQGIFGQSITILPEQRVVVALISNWPAASSSENRGKLMRVLAGISAEAGAPR